jgi:hypothetical protein
MWQRLFFTSRWKGSREKGVQEGISATFRLQRHTSVTYFLQLGPTSYLSPLPNSTIILQIINRLIHSLEQSPHDLLISGKAITDILRGVLY